MSTQTPPLIAATWPSSEVPAPKAITGELYSAQSFTIADDFLGAARKDDGIRRMRLVIGFVFAVLGANRRRGRHSVAEKLAQRGEQ